MLTYAGSNQSDMLNFAPGGRIVIRDSEWVVVRVDYSSDGGQQLTCDGVSELVRGRSAIFLTTLEDDIQLLDPAKTDLVTDTSSGYQRSLLYMESMLRRATPNDEHIHIAQKAAMDLVPYQLDPALQSLKQPRHRILIADAVGLGKTLEAGILVSELIHRGKGKRILVLTLKSMMTQFQKEFWNRFTIPLTRLDSIGLQRVRNRIPTNHNPFYYYDKAIISIDTLKQDSEYRVYLENAYWDIIVIDEVHNVADRGNSSQRARLAKLLSMRSDTLIMLSATPHDGRARSFASLMNMLDPTAISDPENYVKEDFHNKGLVVRRFKKDIQNQVTTEFKDRQIFKRTIPASPEEETAYDSLLAIPFTTAGLHEPDRPASLLRVTLQKAMFSSPSACRESVQKRISQLQGQDEKNKNPAVINEIESLEQLDATLSEVKPERYSKYQALIRLLNDKNFAWLPNDTTDRIVIFSERIETLNFLSKQLRHDIGLTGEQIEILHGGLSDIDQQKIVEAFGKPEARVRILLCSDVASEGINLHYLAHRLIHFDMPWSLMVFQQRNGRIDRYGQEKTPQIYYLVTESRNQTISGDMRILEILQEKDDQAYRNIGDPSAFMHVYDIKEEEKVTESAMLAGISATEFDSQLTPKVDEGEDLLAMFIGTASAVTSSVENGFDRKVQPSLTIFDDDYSFCKQALHQLNADSDQAVFDFDEGAHRISLTAPYDLRHRFGFLPREVVPEDWRFVLTDDKEVIKEEIRRSRQDENAWPKIHYLWPQHPVIEWLNDRMLSAFGRHKAPVIGLSSGLAPGETVFVISGLVPNRKSHPLVYEWMGVSFIDNSFERIEPFAETLNRTGLAKSRIPNRCQLQDTAPFQELLPEAVRRAREWVIEKRDIFESEINKKLNEQLRELERLKSRQYEQLELALGSLSQSEAMKASRKAQKTSEIDRIFDQYIQWVEDTLTTEKQPYLQVISVLIQEQ